jgi:formylmethanofuran dehydrogenase subunit B
VGGAALRSKSLVCTGCGCLCDDLQVELEDEHLVQLENACAKGAALIQSSFNAGRRAKSTIRNRECSLKDAVEQAENLFFKAKNPLVFGLDNSTLEAQALAIELTQKIGGTIDNASSFSYGPLIERILTKDLPTCSLSEIKDNADLLIYWGADPPNTHPRHLSKYTYYAYTDYNPAGWFPKVTLSCVEVRHTELSSMCKPVFRLKPSRDKAFIKTIVGEAQDEVEMARNFTELAKKSRFCVVFCGLGLVHALDSDFSPFARMVHMLSKSTRIAVIPMISETNMRGFCQLLHEKTGHANRVSFAGSIASGSEFSLLEQFRKQPPECVVIIDSDPLSALPPSAMRNLASTNIICLSPFVTPTTIAADVVIPTALPGVECGGSMLRMDGIEVALAELEKREYPTEEAILRQLLEGT